MLKSKVWRCSWCGYQYTGTTKPFRPQCPKKNRKAPCTMEVLRTY